MAWDARVEVPRVPPTSLPFTSYSPTAVKIAPAGASSMFVTIIPRIRAPAALTCQPTFTDPCDAMSFGVDLLLKALQPEGIPLA